MGKNRITCPYHAWTYDLDGQLKRAPHMTEEMGFKVEDIQLHKVDCESWGGFIFLNLSPDEAPPFENHAENSNKLFQHYPLADLRIGASIQYEVNANWKVLCENYNECYHCGPYTRSYAPLFRLLCRPMVPSWIEISEFHIVKGQ